MRQGAPLVEPQHRTRRCQEERQRVHANRPRLALKEAVCKIAPARCERQGQQPLEQPEVSAARLGPLAIGGKGNELVQRKVTPLVAPQRHNLVDQGIVEWGVEVEHRPRASGLGAQHRAQRLVHCRSARNHAACRQRRGLLRTCARAGDTRRGGRTASSARRGAWCRAAARHRFQTRKVKQQIEDDPLLAIGVVAVEEHLVAAVELARLHKIELQVARQAPDRGIRQRPLVFERLVDRGALHARPARDPRDGLATFVEQQLEIGRELGHCALLRRRYRTAHGLITPCRTPCSDARREPSRAAPRAKPVTPSVTPCGGRRFSRRVEPYDPPSNQRMPHGQAHPSARPHRMPCGRRRPCADRRAPHSCGTTQNATIEVPEAYADRITVHEEGEFTYTYPASSLAFDADTEMLYASDTLLAILDPTVDNAERRTLAQEAHGTIVATSPKARTSSRSSSTPPPTCPACRRLPTR